MKKLSIFLASLMCAVPVFSQTEEAPNRLLLKNTLGNMSGYVLDRVDELSFARIDGEVKADVQINSVELDKLNVTVKRTPDCYGFKINVLPAVAANQYDDLAVITVVNRGNPSTWYDDFIGGEMTGIELEPATDYVLVTVGVDGYGIDDGVVRVPFTTPKPALVGDPQVTAEVVESQLTSFKIKFTPNEDVDAYYCVAGEKGTLESQLEQFGPWMGLTSMTDLIMSWGVETKGEQVKEWKDMDPNTDYEVYYVATDVNGTPADYKIIEVSTLSQGGSGAAAVDIEILEYEYADWGGEMKPSQYVEFTPNDQSWCYRFGVWIAEDYDKNAEEIKNNLRSEPPVPNMANWFFFEPIVTDFQIDPNKECVAIAAAKNADGVWGDVTEVRFTTPEKPEGDPGVTGKPASKSSGITARHAAKKSLKSFDFTPEKAPVMRKAGKLRLHQ